MAHGRAGGGRVERLIVRGGRRLHGTVRVAGNKNGAGPALAAALLSDEPVHLRNMPGIGDVDVFIDLLRGLKVEIEPDGEAALVASAARVSSGRVDAQLGGQIRMSLLVPAPLLAGLGPPARPRPRPRRSHCRHPELPPPGGDALARRLIDPLLLACQALGAKVDAS